MNVSLFLLIGLFILVVSATMGVVWFMSRSSVRSRLQTMNRPAEQNLSVEVMEKPDAKPGDRVVLDRFETAVPVVEPPGGWDKSPLRKRLMMAGYHNVSLPGFFYVLKIVLTVVLCFGTFVLIDLMTKEMESTKMVLLALAGAAVGYLLPEFVLNRLVMARQERIRKGLPEAADFLVVCVEAGTALDGAFLRVAKEMQLSCPDLANEMNWVTLEFRAGRPRAVALQNLAERTGVDDVETLTNMLNQADRFGTSTAAALRVYAEMLRVKRKQQAQELAAKIPVKLLFPLIFCIFPALLVVLAGPAMVQVTRVLLPTMSDN